MAVYTWYSTSATGAVKEDVLDRIIMLEAYDRTLLSELAKGSCTQATHSWLHDTYAVPAANSNIEGADATAETLSGQERLSNNTQIFNKVIQVSRTMIETSQYGKKTEVGYQKLKKAKELASDIEFALITGASATGASATARTLAGVLAHITTNISAYSAAAVLTAADTGFEIAYNDILEDVFTSGGDPKWALMSPFQKRRCTSWSAYTTRNIDAKDRRLVAAVDVYESNFGLQRLIPHRIWGLSSCARDKLAVLDPKKWRVCRLSPTHTDKLGKTGDSEKWQLVVELTLEAQAEEANGQISGLATAV